MTLQPPEPDTHIVIVDVRATDAAAAVASAWGSYKPDMRRPLRVAVSIPDRNGWKDGKQFNYETSPRERAVVVAIALHAGGTWTVVLADGKEPTFEKRGASTVASHKNDDGTISFITIDPTRSGFEFVEAERDGRRALIIRDGQHEYVFSASS